MDAGQKKNRIASAEPWFPEEDVEWILGEIRGLLASGALTRGPRVTEFEKLFAEITGVKHAIAVSSGTQALELALRHYALDGGEVVVPTNTFLASANAVLFAGGRPVFADIDGNSLCVGVRQVEAALSDRTRGVMVVHIGGVICPEIEAIRELCRSRGLFLMEDASHAHGADWKGKRAGSFGDVAAFSLFPTKPMTTGEGGLITTDDDALARFARVYRSHGTPEGESLNLEVGTNFRMDEIRAVLGITQVRRLESFLEARQRVAKRYEEGLAGLEGLELQPVPAGMRSGYYKFATILPTVERRRAVAEALKKKHGIDNGTLYWPACHLQPVVKNHPELYVVRTPMTNAEDVLPRVVCLPISAKLPLETVDRIVEAVKTEVRASAGAAKVALAS